jgi:hypothetical protein
VNCSTAHGHIERAPGTINPVAWRNEVEVRFAPKATQLLCSSEMTRSANTPHPHIKSGWLRPCLGYSFRSPSSWERTSVVFGVKDELIPIVEPRPTDICGRRYPRRSTAPINIDLG